MASSPYFDGCYFDGTYFDASICTGPVTPTLGRHVRGRGIKLIDIHEVAPDQTALVLLLTEADDG